MTIFDQIEAESNSTTKFVKLESGQKALFKFDSAKISIVEDTFQDKKVKRVNYKVVNPNTGEEKDFRIGFMHSKQLNALLKAGLNMIIVERIGTGLSTRYTFAPAVGSP